MTARIWPGLSGPAKRLVQNFKPGEFETENGLERFLKILKDSPLGKLALPDTFRRIDDYLEVKRMPGEPMSCYIVREEEAFEDLEELLSG